MRSLLDWAREIDLSFLVTLVILAILGAGLWVFGNIAHELMDSSVDKHWIGVVNGDFIPQESTPASMTPTALPAAAPTMTRTATVQPTIVSATPTLLPPTPTTVLVYGIVRQVSGGGVIVREQPNRNSRPVGNIASGERVEIVDTARGEAIEAQYPDWYKVRYQNITGYVYGRLIDKQP